MFTQIRAAVRNGLLPLLLLGGAVAGAGAEEKAKDANAYPLTFCATCGPEEAGEELITKTHKGREIKLCKGCVKIYTADPDAYIKKVDKVIKEHAAKGGAEKGHEGHDHDGHDHKDGDKGATDKAAPDKGEKKGHEGHNHD